MNIVFTDMDGVLVPEIWQQVAKSLQIDGLMRTTRDEPDYDKLMKYRIDLLSKHDVTIHDIQAVIAEMNPMDGAKEFISWVGERAPIIVLSDTFEQFAKPLMMKLGSPTLMCHSLDIDEDGKIYDYSLRIDDQKTKTVKAFQDLNYHVSTIGDSYNDIGMLQAANQGLLFKPPENVVEDYPQFPVSFNYEELKEKLVDTLR